jgi:hypothetical protein
MATKTAKQNKSPPLAHTPGPYHVEDEFIFASNGLRIADTDCEGQGMLDGEADANADFIVRACNSYYDLLDIAEKAMKYFPPSEFHELISAITKARGQT